MPGVVQLSTGVWYDPEEPGRVGTMCRHGNPNVLTRDAGTSRLAQGPTAQTCLVDVERYDGRLEPVGVFTLPPFAKSAKIAALATQRKEVEQTRRPVNGGGEGIASFI